MLPADELKYDIAQHVMEALEHREEYPDAALAVLEEESARARKTGDAHLLLRVIALQAETLACLRRRHAACAAIEEALPIADALNDESVAEWPAIIAAAMAVPCRMRRGGVDRKGGKAASGN